MNEVTQVPAKQRDEQATKALEAASLSIGLALQLAPNWKDSRFLTEDIQRMDGMKRDLDIMTMDPRLQ